jgi:hypothetical protein
MCTFGFSPDKRTGKVICVTTSDLSMSLRGVEINDFFKFERKMSFDFLSFVNDINILQKYILLDKNIGNL